MASKSRAAKSGTTKVRTTFNPAEVIEVDAAELLDLERQGLIYTGEAPAPPAEGDKPTDKEGGA